MAVRRLGPLGIRFAVAFVGVALAAVAIFACAVLVADRGEVSDAAGAQQDHVANALTTVLRNTYLSNRSWSGADLRPAQALTASTGTAARVENRAGQVVVAVGPARLFGRGHRRVTRPLDVGSARLGTVDVAFTPGGPNQSDMRLRAGLAGAVGWSAALAAFAALLVGVIVARGVSRPIRRLSAAAKALEHGHGALPLGPEAGPGELGELGRAFDSMAASLEREDRLRRALVADVAHELRTPVAILQAETEALLDGVAPPSAQALASLHDEVLRLGRMVEDLQTLASAEAAGLQLERRPLDLGQVVTEAAASLAPRFRAAGVTLREEVSPTLVLGDPYRLHQVVANLLANAVKFTPGGGTVSARVTHVGAYGRLEVVDSGPGVPETERPLIWERFYRGENGKVTAGSGIGLAVVKELVDAHGGAVTVDGAPGGGARFSVDIPLAPAGTVELGEPPAATAPELRGVGALTRVRWAGVGLPLRSGDQRIDRRRDR